MNGNISKRKAFYIALSVLVAAVIWIFVDLVGTTDGTPRVIEKQVKDVPITYVGEDILESRGLMLLEDETARTVDLNLTGTRADIAWLDVSAIKVRLSLTDITETGERTLGVSVYFSDKRGFNHESTVKAKPVMVSVNIGELDTKEIDVKCEIVGSVAQGFTAGQLQMSRTTMEIRGQTEDIAPVSYAKVVLNLDNAESTVVQDLAYEYYDANAQPLDSRGIYSSVETIQVTLPVTVTKELRLVMNFIQSPGASRKNIDYDINPKTVMVSGDAALLKDMESIVLDDLDLASLTGPITYSYPITVPEGCENLSGVTRAELKISFKDMVREDRTTTNFIFENLPEGKHCEILTAEMTVSIFGTSADVAAVTGENIQVAADLSGFGSANGSYTVPAEIRVRSGGDVGVSGTYQVRVTISEPPEETPPEGDAPAEPAGPAE